MQRARETLHQSLSKAIANKTVYSRPNPWYGNFLVTGDMSNCTAYIPPYASVQILSKYISAVDPGNPRADTLRVKIAKRKVMLRIHAIFTIAIALLNIGITIWLMLSFSPDSQGVGTLAFGNCSYIANVNTAVHLALDIISSLFLDAGNYCMQILVSPSRKETDVAHSKGKALTVGVPNVKNLWHIEWKPVVVWILIAIFATVLHNLLVRLLYVYSLVFYLSLYPP